VIGVLAMGMMSVEKGVAFNDHQATLTVSSGGTQVAHAAVYVFIK